MNPKQLEAIQKTRIAIGGLGLGGSVFINLVRMGFVDFHVADPDVYERTNCNRQRLAKEPSIGRRKDECLIEEARAINPEVRIRSFSEGVQLENVSEFLKDRHWIVDTVDVFAMKEKLALNAEAHRLGLKVVSCASVGFMGVAVAFKKGSPSFAELSGISPQNPNSENFSRFVRFISPDLPEYMAGQVLTAMNGGGHIPFVVQGVEISAALATSLIANDILGLEEPTWAPQGVYLDPIRLRAGTFEAHYQARELIRKSRLKAA